MRFDRIFLFYEPAANQQRVSLPDQAGSDTRCLLTGIVV